MECVIHDNWYFEGTDTAIITEGWASEKRRTIQAKGDGARIGVIVSPSLSYNFQFKNGAKVFFEGNSMAFGPRNMIALYPSDTRPDKV